MMDKSTEGLATIEQVNKFYDRYFEKKSEQSMTDKELPVIIYKSGDPATSNKVHVVSKINGCISVDAVYWSKSSKCWIGEFVAIQPEWVLFWFEIKDSKT